MGFYLFPELTIRALRKNSTTRFVWTFFEVKHKRRREHEFTMRRGHSKSVDSRPYWVSPRQLVLINSGVVSVASVTTCSGRDGRRMRAVSLLVKKSCNSLPKRLPVLRYGLSVAMSCHNTRHRHVFVLDASAEFGCYLAVLSCMH